jgi:hypothetical protein
MGKRVGSALLALMALLTGCRYSKETVPVTRSYEAVRVPNQQRLVALAVEEAVEALDFKALAGKTVALQVDGIFPHSNEDLLGYLRSQIEGKLARSGARVVNSAPVLVVPGVVGAATTATTTVTPQQMQLSEPSDYKVLVGVSWGGIDTRDRVRTDEPLLTKQIGLGAGGLLTGLFLAALSNNNDDSSSSSGESSMFGSFRTRFALGIAVAAPVGAWLWYRHDSPFPHTYTLHGRVRVVAQAIPMTAGTAFTTEGKGESKLIIDETNPEGYMVAP